MAQIHEDLEEDFLVLLAFVLCWWMLNCLLMCYLLWLLDTSVHTLVNPGLWFFLKKNKHQRFNIWFGLLLSLSWLTVNICWYKWRIFNNGSRTCYNLWRMPFRKEKKISGEWPVTLRCHLQMFIRSSSYYFRVLLRFHPVLNASCVYWILVALACMLRLYLVAKSMRKVFAKSTEILFVCMW